MRTCSVTATNQDAWNTLKSIIGGNVSAPIIAQTTYSLSCIGLDNKSYSQKAVVNVLSANPR